MRICVATGSFQQQQQQQQQPARPKKNWLRSIRSVHLPRSKLVEIVPQMQGISAEEGGSLSRSGHLMTLETLSPISQLPSTSKKKPNEEPKELLVCNDCLSNLSEDSTASKVNKVVKEPDFPKSTPFGRLLCIKESSDNVSEWDERLLSPTENQNKENKDTSKLKILPNPSKDELRYSSWILSNDNVPPQNSDNKDIPSEVPKWNKHRSDCIIISSDDEGLPGQTNAAIKKRHKQTATKLRKNVSSKKSRQSTGKYPNADPTGSKDKQDTKGKQIPRLTRINLPPSKDNPIKDTMQSPHHSEDFVFHQNLDNKIAVKTVMPKFLSNLSSSFNCQPSSSNDNTNENPMWLKLSNQWTAPNNNNDFLINENQYNEVAVQQLLPLILQPQNLIEGEDIDLSNDGSHGNPMRNLNRKLERKDTLVNKDIKGKEKLATNTAPKTVWNTDNLCECAMREIQSPEASQTNVESWRSIEAICMRLRDITVPGKVGLLEETPFFEDIFDVLGIQEEQPESNRASQLPIVMKEDASTDSENETVLKFFNQK
ncbi:uncharacterized protein LOC108041344 [Drosophila rhopaloa]|uniref:Uncharacterized protein LOC108041344 n=1 Tax=Drosophila rhopaloa TaxID=1041015 RepID=A0A6P4E9Q6_DRORH|nr:uncharacterized protein LOC108041344 [Drosophila rhopaloa]